MGNWLTWVEAHQGLASWLQAFGGLAAICAAIIVAAVEHFRADRAAKVAIAREEARREEEDRRARRVLVNRRSAGAAMISFAIRRLETTSRLIRGSKTSALGQLCRIHSNDMTALTAQMLTFPAFDLEDAVASDAFAQARSIVGNVQNYLDYQQQELDKRYEARHDEVANIVDGMAANLAEAWKAYEDQVGISGSHDRSVPH